jgi:hypothetical protein
LSLAIGVWATAWAEEKVPGSEPSKPAVSAAAPQLAANPEGDEPSGTPESSSEEAAPSGKLSLAGDLTFASKYLFQGLDYSEGRSVFQPNFVASLGAFSATAWGNFQPDLGDVNEVDLSLKYSGTLNRLSISPGYTYLHYPNRVDWDPSQELFVDLGADVPLHPALSLHYDFDAGDGLYATMGLSQAVHGPVTAGVNVFYQSRYYEMTGVPAMELKMSGSWSFPAVSLTPSISRFVTWSNGDFKDAAAVPSTWLFSLNLARPIF